MAAQPRAPLVIHRVYAPDPAAMRAAVERLLAEPRPTVIEADAENPQPA